MTLPSGACLRPGIAPDGCAEGFVHDGAYGCEPILAPEPCPRGQMAVPGDAECHAVMLCGEGRWGDIPVDGATVYVDASYGGGSSDGSEAQPFTTIGEAFAAAQPNRLIAVAEGQYPEDVVLQGKPVRLWGRCPDQVEVLSGGAEIGAIVIRDGASGSEVHGLAVGGLAAGVAPSGTSTDSPSRSSTAATAAAAAPPSPATARRSASVSSRPRRQSSEGGGTFAAWILAGEGQSTAWHR